MGWTEKVAVTLPKEDMRKLRLIEAKRRIPFSAVVREAVRTWLKIQEHAELREQYRRYYADPAVRAEDEALAEQMAKTSARNWPPY